MKALILSILMISWLQADCKITKQTYNVVEGNNSCTYVSYWEEGRVNGLYRAQRYKLEVSPLCATFQHLKGRLVQKEVIDEIIGRDCVYSTERGGEKD